MFLPIFLSARLVEEGKVVVAEVEVLPLVEGAAEEVAREIHLEEAHARLLGDGHVPTGQGNVRKQLARVSSDNQAENQVKLFIY